MYNIIGSDNGEKIECFAAVELKTKCYSKKIFVCDCYFNFDLKWRLQKTNWENIYHEVTEIMNEIPFMLFSKKFVICCETNFLAHLFTDGWQTKFYGKANRDCLEEHFIVCNSQCTDLLDETANKPVDVFNLCLNCRRHFLSAILIKFHCF